MERSNVVAGAFERAYKNIKLIFENALTPEQRVKASKNKSYKIEVLDPIVKEESKVIRQMIEEISKDITADYSIKFTGNKKLAVNLISILQNLNLIFRNSGAGSIKTQLSEACSNDTKDLKIEMEYKPKNVFLKELSFNEAIAGGKTQPIRNDEAYQLGLKLVAFIASRMDTPGSFDIFDLVLEPVSMEKPSKVQGVLKELLDKDKISLEEAAEIIRLVKEARAHRNFKEKMGIVGGI